MTEFQLCESNPTYFINKYVVKLRSYQEDLIEQIHQHPTTLVNSARQMGVTTVLLAYILWMVNFKADTSGILIHVRSASAINSLDRLKEMHDKLPESIKTKRTENDRRRLALSNGSKVQPVSTIAGLCNKESHITFIDDAVFRTDLQEMMSEYLQQQGKLILASTLYKSGWFTDRCIEAKTEQSDYNYIELPYYLNTKLNRLFRMKADTTLGTELAKVSYDCTHYMVDKRAINLLDERD